MKCKNKSKLLPWSAEAVIIFAGLVLTITTHSGCAQPYNPYHHDNRHHGAYQNVLGDPYRHYSYQFMPSSTSAGGANLIDGGRIVEAVKVRPLHYSSMFGGSSHRHHHHPATSQFLSAAASQPSSAFHSGYSRYPYPPTGRQPPYSVSSSMYADAGPHYETISPTTVTTITSPSSPPVFHSFGRPSRYHPQNPHSTLPSRFPPGPIASPSMDTYREALDLFSEVVRKLEKETVPGFGTFSAPSYLQSTLLSNGIYGSANPSSGLPQHIDNIMGPDFLQRAHKLYNKIIKEQNHYHRRPEPSGYYSSASRGHPLNGLSYLENTIRPSDIRGSNRARTTSYSYSQSSPHSRNMIVDKTDSALERSLIDTVKALEVNLGKDNDGREQLDEDIMETSESRMVPQSAVSSSVYSPPAQPASPLPLESSSTINPFAIPLNENDFIEHPLPYNEYEELMKQIAENYNY